MRAIKKYGSLMLILFSVAILHAQTPAAPAPPAPAATAKGALSVAEMKTQSEALIGQIAEDHRQVLYLKEVAKKEKDVIKLNCVNDKLVQMKAQMNIADDMNVELQTALTNSSDDRFVLFSNLSKQREAIKVLRDQANACVGEPELIKQEAGLSSVTHPDIPDDPNDTPVGVEVEIEPPGYASPFN